MASQDQKQENQTWRLLNRDGSFNVERRGLHTSWSHDLYHSLLSLSWPKFLGFVLLFYICINFAFALAYLACGHGALVGGSTGTPMDRFSDAFFFSVQTFATIGYGRIVPVGLLPNLLVTMEALTGLLLLAVVTGIMFSRFARPTARVVFSQKATITSHEGTPSLLFRMANRRLNQIVEAQVSVVLTVTEKTLEGQSYRTFYDLTLERSRSPLFVLSWTVVHPITKDSPLHGKNHQYLVDANAEIFVNLTGIDDTFAQTIHTRFSYAPEDIVWNHDFVDIIRRSPKGLVSVDLKRIHDLEANGPL